MKAEYIIAIITFYVLYKLLGKKKNSSVAVKQHTQESITSQEKIEHFNNLPTVIKEDSNYKVNEEEIDLSIIVDDYNKINATNNNFSNNREIYYPQPDIDTMLQNKINILKSIIQELETSFTTDIEISLNKNYKINYANELNLKQLEAVTTIDGKTLVIAGAGSGKTRTLIYRTSYLLENNILAENILLLTFTRKASEETKKRVNQLLDSSVSNNIMSGTFHSFCNMLLNKYAKLLHINPKFTILDQEDSNDLIDLLKKQYGFKKKEEIAFPRKQTIQNIISSSRNRLITIEKIMYASYPNLECYITDIIELSKLYHQYKRENHLYDYDDLIEETINHLKKNIAFKNSIQSKYKYIMVDEYQDTNLPQKELVEIIAGHEESSLMVVGDDNQSIYSFRGANYENILFFGQTYTNAKLIKLEENYRSTPKILEFINNISDNISLGYRKKLFSNDHDLYEKPKFTRLSSDEQEARFIADAVLKLKETISYKEISVLCRSSFHSNFVQAEFLKRNIPFVFVGGVQFIAKRHIKDILAYFKIIWNPFDKISWHRVLTILSGIGKVTANKIADEIHSANGELSPLQNSSYIRKNENIQLLYEILNNASNAHSLIKAFDIIEEYYIPILKKVEENWKTRIEDFKVLKRLCAEHNDFEKFLSNLALDPPKDNKLEYTAVDKKDDNKDFVTISTIHSAKGLEWNSVFVISLIDGAVPSNRSFNDYEQLEEERKLFYVACSRAKQNLYLTTPSYLTTYSGYFDNYSRFINEIDSTKYDYEEYTTL